MGEVNETGVYITQLSVYPQRIRAIKQHAPYAAFFYCVLIESAGGSIRYYMETIFTAKWDRLIS